MEEILSETLGKWQQPMSSSSQQPGLTTWLVCLGRMGGQGTRGCLEGLQNTKSFLLKTVHLKNKVIAEIVVYIFPVIIKSLKGARTTLSTLSSVSETNWCAYIGKCFRADTFPVLFLGALILFLAVLLYGNLLDGQSWPRDALTPVLPQLETCTGTPGDLGKMRIWIVSV